MSSRLLPVFAAAILITVGATAASACDGEKSRSAKATTAAAASAEKSCGTKSVTKSASMAKVASAKGSCSTKSAKSSAAMASASTCQVGKAANAVFASASDKSAHCATAKAAMAAGEDYVCAGKSTAAAVAVASGSGKVDAVVAGSQCKTSTAKASKYAHADCESCADWSVCEGELAKAGSQMQVVPLKNGVMYVFTSSDPNDAGIVQAVLSSRNNRVKALMQAGDNASLCGQCKAFRGAIASGNLTREVVNIEGGSLMIMTSPDNGMVDQLYSLAGIHGKAPVEG